MGRRKQLHRGNRLASRPGPRHAATTWRPAGWQRCCRHCGPPAAARRHSSVPSTWNATATGCATPTSALPACAWAPAWSKVAARLLSAPASSDPACTGPWLEPMPSSLCVAALAVADSRTIGHIGPPRPETISEVCRTPCRRCDVRPFMQRTCSGQDILRSASHRAGLSAHDPS